MFFDNWTSIDELRYARRSLENFTRMSYFRHPKRQFEWRPFQQQ